MPCSLTHSGHVPAAVVDGVVLLAEAQEVRRGLAGEAQPERAEVEVVSPQPARSPTRAMEAQRAVRCMVGDGGYRNGG
jgi:hypothetical protein